MSTTESGLQATILSTFRKFSSLCVPQPRLRRNGAADDVLEPPEAIFFSMEVNTPGNPLFLPSAELLPQFRLHHLARRGTRNLLGKYESIGKPDPGELRGKIVAQLDLRCRFSRLEHHHRQRPLAPPFVLYTDDRGFRHLGMAHERVFKCDRAAARTARRHEILDAIR